MQVMLGASSIIPPLEARKWIGAIGQAGILQGLETWIRTKERTWGDCCVFIEVIYAVWSRAHSRPLARIRLGRNSPKSFHHNAFENLARGLPNTPSIVAFVAGADRTAFAFPSWIRPNLFRGCRVLIGAAT